MRKPIRGNVPIVLTDEQIIELRKIYAQIRQIEPASAYSMLCLSDTTEEERRFFAAVGDLNTYGRSWEAEQAEAEDLYDAASADEAYAEYVESGCKSTAADEFWKELDAEQPNEETIAAMLEAERIVHDPTARRYHDVEEALAALRADEDDEVDEKLQEAERKAALTDQRYSSGEVLRVLRELKSEFGVESIRPAVEAMIAEAHEVALGNGEYYTYDEVFGEDDDEGTDL